MIEQVRALPHHAASVVFDRFERNLAGLFNDLLRYLARSGFEQLKRPGIARRRYLAERDIEALEFAANGTLPRRSPVRGGRTERAPRPNLSFIGWPAPSQRDR